MKLITIYFCINYNFFWQWFSKKLYNNGPLNVKNFTLKAI